MTNKFIRVDLRNLKGIKRAESLQRKDWLIVENSLDTIIFMKGKK